MGARVVMAGGPLRNLAAGLFLIAVATGCAATSIGGPQAPRGAPDAGVLVLPSGRSTSIYPTELRFTGRAEYRWPDGRVYDGEWRNGTPHGQGTETRPDGERYNGAWLDGVRHGLGELVADGGSLYQGEFQDGARHGRGVQFSDEGIYQGDWRADREHGYGELAGAYGSHYTGEWREGLRAGRGSHQGADGSSYQGEWLDDRPHGSGLYRFPDGSVYEGQWQAGRQQGTGRLLAASGVSFEGNWQAGERSGFGIEQRPDGSGYTGEWQAGKRSGQGRETWADGGFHEGSWELNQTIGPGRRRYSSGIEIQGAWTGDSVSSGLLTLPDGAEFAGPLFRNGNARASPLLQQWLQVTAAGGDLHAGLLAGTLYLDYAEPEPDPVRARAWLEPAAAEVSEAAFRYGVLLLERGTASEQDKGLRWLERAAGSDHAEAHRVLGDLHFAGTLAPADPARAIEHYAGALRGGSPLAAERLARALVTAPDPATKDPARAIAVLEWVALHAQAWQQFDTLALAYAANGDRAAAALAQQRAIQAATAMPGAVPDWPRPRPATPARAGSPLIDPPSVAPDIAAMQARLEQYRSTPSEADSLDP